MVQEGRQAAVGKGGGEKGAEEPLATKVMSGREREGVGWVFGLACGLRRRRWCCGTRFAELAAGVVWGCEEHDDVEDRVVSEGWTGQTV
jgi:hypothetical protein